MKKSTPYLLQFFISLLIALVALPASYIQAQETNDLYSQSSEVHPLIVQMRADEGSLSRFYFMQNSPEYIQRFQKLYADYLQQLNSLNFESFNANTRADYLLVKRDLENKQYLLAIALKEYNQIKKWIPFADKVYAIEKPRRRGITVNGSQVAAELNIIEKELLEAKAALEKEESLNRDLAYRLQGTIKDLQEGLKSVYNFYYDYDPGFTWWVPEPYKRVDTLLAAYADVAIKKGKVPGRNQKIDKSGIVGKPIGREELIRQLQYEMIPYTPEELIEVAKKEFDWCDREMLIASRELGFGDNWHKALEKVKNTYVPAGQQPEAMLKLYNESIDFLKKKDLITIPPLAEETWRMQMMTPERQLVNPFFLGGETFIISYPTTTMTHEQKLMSMRGNNPHFSRATVHHELIAGHHLQGFMNKRHKAYRYFNTPFWVEGWALYWEMQLWDQGFPKTAEDRIGMLFWRMHRCARIIFSLNYHMNKWAPQECIDFLVDRVGHERANAEGEVRRSFEGRYSPLYQVAYMMGGLQFYALHKELVGSGKMTNKQFHDAVMRENAMPVEMLRAILKEEKLPADYKTSWKFYATGVTPLTKASGK
jgi:CHASE3 domain sensor protein